MPLQLVKNRSQEASVEIPECWDRFLERLPELDHDNPARFFAAVERQTNDFVAGIEHAESLAEAKYIPEEYVVKILRG